MDRLLEFVTNHWALFLALGIVLALLVEGELRRFTRGFKDIGPLEAIRLINHEEAVVVDVREDGEFREGHILNALHIPLGTLEARVKELEKHKDKPLLVYCRSGQRSARACTLLRKHGFDTVYHLGGGLLAWQNANLPVTRKDK